MKTPITYYGGKQNLSGIIIRLIPDHQIYCEPFAGGAAIFFAKEPSKIEILNDMNAELINFYEVLKTDFDALSLEVHVSLYSRKLHKNARVVYENPDMFSRVKRAWAVWFLLATSFNSQLSGFFGIDSHSKRVNVLLNKQRNFTDKLSERLKNTRLENYDAVKVIHDNDSYDAFFYIDPPYVGAHQGHYTGYTQSNFTRLLKAISEISGKFLLSSYQNDYLFLLVKKNGWYQIKMEMVTAASSKKTKSHKTEVLTANYPISIDGHDTKGLFDGV